MIRCYINGKSYLFSGMIVTALLLLLVVHYNRKLFPSVQLTRFFFAFIGNGFGSRKADTHVRSRYDYS